MQSTQYLLRMPTDMSDIYPAEGLVAIGQLARRSGVQASTLRTWEARYGLPAPTRTVGGQRRYALEQLDRVVEMRRLIEIGYATSEAARIVGARSRPSTDPNQLERIENLLINGDVRALRELDRLAEAKPCEEVVLQVVVPVLHTVERRWASGALTVAEEHAASALVMSWIGGQSRLLPPSLDSALVMTACPAGERHDLGLALLGLLVRRQGVRLVHLGPDIPTEDLVSVVARKSPSVVCLGVTTAVGADGLRTAIEALGERGHGAIAIGGPAAHEVERPESVTLLPPELDRAAAMLLTLARSHSD